MARALVLAGFVLTLLCCTHPSGPSTAGRTAQGAHVFETAATYQSESSEGGVRGDAADAEFERLVAGACGRAGLELDGRLAQVAEQLAQESEGARRAPTYARVNFYTRGSGLIEPTPEVWLASGPSVSSLGEALEAAVKQAASASELTHCGGAAREEGRAVVAALALSGRFVSLDEPLPRSVERGTHVALKGSLSRGYSTPVLAVTDPRGKVSRKPLGRGRDFADKVELGQRGEYTLELLANGPRGVTVVAMFPIAVDVAVAQEAPADDDTKAEGNAEAVRERLFALVNEERKRRDLAPLRKDDRLGRAAAAHSTDMVVHHFIAHTSPTTGDASDRVRNAGLNALVVLENIGRGYSAREIHDGLMASPGHRGNILNEDARELGVGVVAEPEGDRLAFIATELFTKLARDLTPGAFRKELARSLERVRKREKVPDVRVDDKLSALAEAAAARFVRAPGQDERALLDETTRGVREPPKGVKAIAAALVLADDPDQVLDTPRFKDKALRALGIGVAELPSGHAHRFAIVLLIGLSE